MRTLLALAVSLSLCSLGMTGCTKQESGVKTTEKTTTDGGSKEVTKEMKVEKSGDNPPN